MFEEGEKVEKIYGKAFLTPLINFLVASSRLAFLFAFLSCIKRQTRRRARKGERDDVYSKLIDS